MFAILAERELGPKLYGIFPQGRLEQYVPVSHHVGIFVTVYQYMLIKCIVIYNNVLYAVIKTMVTMATSVEMLKTERCRLNSMYILIWYPVKLMVNQEVSK